MAWLHVVSDALIALNYFSIPVTLINSYESSVHLIDSMVNQHAKWLEKCNDVPWRIIWNSANNDQGTGPDLGLASCGDVPTPMC